MSKYQELCSLLKFNQIIQSFDKLVIILPNSLKQQQIAKNLI